MLHGDYDVEQILSIGLPEFQQDRLVSVTAEELFAHFSEMAEFFSRGALEDNIKSMIEHFRQSTGAEYSSQELTDHVRVHESTKHFEAVVRKELDRLLRKYKGGVGWISANEINVAFEDRPKFNGKLDTVTGLRIAINDTWAWDVDLLEYTLSGSNYFGKFAVTLYDHFGLDRNDVATFGGVPWWVNMLPLLPWPGPVPLVADAVRYIAERVARGFRAWFVLQHLDRMNFRPFVTRIAIDYHFSGTLDS
jgi:hypothetical protein